MPKKNNGYSPAENTENEVHHEEGSEDDHGHKVDELPSIPLWVVDLEEKDVIKHFSWYRWVEQLTQ